MRNTARLLAVTSFAVVLASAPGMPRGPLHAQEQAPAPPPAAAPQQPPPDFRVTVDLITTDMIARDSKSAQFIADLKPEEIEIYEDGVKQKIASIELIHGGRA